MVFFRLVRLLAVVAACALGGVRADLPPGCQEGSSMPADQFSSLYTKLKDTPCTFPLYLRLYELEQYVRSVQGYGLSPNQTVALGSLFADGGLWEQLVLDGALTALGPVTLGLAAEEDGVRLLQLTSNQNTRIDVLKAIVNVTLDLENASIAYVNEFPGFLYREEAKKIIAAATPYGCVFGNTTMVQRLAFVIDVSGSMDYTFPGPDGKPVSRLSFVKEQLTSQLQAHLDADQEFNIIKFSSSASAWSPGVQPVTAANIASASAFAAALRASGSTNMLAGLQLAMNDPKVEGIYLLTDGTPDQPTPSIVSAVVAWSKGTKPVFPTAFMAGTDGDWMQELADKTGGIFRKINS
jgi:hypothetical protein